MSFQKIYGLQPNTALLLRRAHSQPCGGHRNRARERLPRPGRDEACLPAPFVALEAPTAPVTVTVPSRGRGAPRGRVTPAPSVGPPLSRWTDPEEQALPNPFPVTTESLSVYFA